VSDPATEYEVEVTMADGSTHQLALGGPVSAEWIGRNILVDYKDAVRWAIRKREVSPWTELMSMRLDRK
jgi:hypothetical protein